MPLKNELGELELIAYFISRVQPPPSVSALRRFLIEKLAAHMIPSHFVTLDELPLTPNGKINRAALPLPVPLPSNAERIPDAPSKRHRGEAPGHVDQSVEGSTHWNYR